MRIGTASITRSMTATAEAIFWQAIEAFVIRARTTSLDPRSSANVALARIKTGVPSQLFSHYAPRGAMMKLLSIIAAVMALIVASSTAMAAPKKTHRMKSPQSVPAPLRQWPPNNPTYEEYL
jgi:hypothetical protein